ncbi:iron chelate uptake ABC transporter family permease subunit [Corynebacterium sp. 320]|uniref:Iron chelate uptake ABC transporter family permease subunit n=1 Tax=Corynebacterium zhongnanshanii TaxID=2768834 RepID=A0ABQ6VGW4_9CORY|nr:MULTISPECIES: iron chelate uptake ABC transporter family permease subunit [Corynebacterium]KAB1504535.1 iron chelate uptake ABC transporter family permease subunit [Corynebacterium sp. 320]KAB1553404.1 iron chelate uptake ABC transporter family permease subunit [Corynebacterium sp. 321]KAB1554486.1 iron chelate uptake ABC transporter family permease subunit [Corynebacterium sp. 319]KAB3523654.1 iron chelate uptake ABC transporter family permease subunit [Corynebacterium zhongnanshanii]KAB35
MASIGMVITLGTADISLVNVRDILTNHLFSTDIPVRRSEDAIVWEDRLPRSLVAACCGAGLALCGVIMQSLLKNPLADPYVLGISSGASTGAVVVGVLGIGGLSVGLSLGAFVGAMISFATVLWIARMAGGTGSIILLAGVAATQLFSAVTSLIIFAFADSDETRGVMFWLLGSLEGVRWKDVWLCLTVVTVAVALCCIFAHVLDAFTFGDDVAGSLGINVPLARLALLSLTALLTATLVSVAGAIGFIGLVLPHAGRLLVGPTHSSLIPVTVIAGALFMVWVDALSRVIFSPTPLPAGVGTALVGVPVFVALLVKRKGIR